jgi:hypothetical protein
MASRRTKACCRFCWSVTVGPLVGVLLSFRSACMHCVSRRVAFQLAKAIGGRLCKVPCGGQSFLTGCHRDGYVARNMLQIILQIIAFILPACGGLLPHLLGMLGPVLRLRVLEVLLRHSRGGCSGRPLFLAGGHIL